MKNIEKKKKWNSRRKEYEEKIEKLRQIKKQIYLINNR